MLIKEKTMPFMSKHGKLLIDCHSSEQIMLWRSSRTPPFSESSNVRHVETSCWFLASSESTFFSFKNFIGQVSASSTVCSSKLICLLISVCCRMIWPPVVLLLGCPAEFLRNSSIYLFLFKSLRKADRNRSDIKLYKIGLTAQFMKIIVLDIKINQSGSHVSDIEVTNELYITIALYGNQQIAKTKTTTASIFMTLT